MPAPVRLESEFFDDPSIDALAKLLGYEDRDTAAGKLARLFSWQTEKYTTERPTYAVPRSTLVGIFGMRGPEAMVEAGLATCQEDGLYKIHGSDKPNGRTPGKTRVNWLHLDRQKQAERGKRRADAVRDEDRQEGRFASHSPAGDQPECVRQPAADQPPASSPFSGLSSPEQISFSPRAVLGHAIERLNGHRTRIRPASQPLRSLALILGPESPEARALERISRLPEADRQRDTDRAIDVLVAKVEAGDADFGELRVGVLFGPASFDALVAAWPPQAKGTGPPRSRGLPRSPDTVGIRHIPKL